MSPREFRACFPFPALGRRARSMFVAAFAATLAPTLAVSVAVAAVGAEEGAAGKPAAAEPGPVLAAAAMRPVTVIDRADIDLSGVKNVSDLLFSRWHFNGFGLRAVTPLGSGRTVFLVDGRPIPASTLEALPMSAVERVEVLDGSAAALHGVQAVDGAVNIVLRRGHEGFEARSSFAAPEGAGGDARHGSFLWGGAFGECRVAFGADVYRRREIRSADREYSRASWTPGGAFADAIGVSKYGNTLYIPTRKYGEDGITVEREHFTPPADSEIDAIARSLGACQGGAYTGPLTDPGGVAGTGCGFAWANFGWERTRLERQSFSFRFEHAVGAEADLYADARVARVEILELGSPASEAISFKLSNDLWANLRDQLHPDAPNLAVAPDDFPEDDPLKLSVDHRFVGHGGRDLRRDIEDYEVAAGVRGRSAGGIGYDAHLQYFRSDSASAGGGFVSRSAVVGAIEDGRYDLGNPLSQDPANLAAIRDSTVRLDRELVETHRTARASLDGTGFTLGGGDLRWTAGGEIDYEEGWALQEYLDAAGGSHPPIDVIGLGGNTYRGERRRWSAFAVATLPLHRRFEVDVGGRRDDYDDVGTAYSRHLASRLRVHDAVTLRGAWSRGAQAPSLFLLNLPQAIYFRSVCDTRNFTGNLSECDRTSVRLTSGGNPDLEPDEAESVSIGFAASLGPVRLSADAFRSKVEEEPAIVPAQILIDREAAGEELPPGAAIVRNSAGTIERIENPLINEGERRVAGFDLRAGVRWEHAWADLAFDARWHRLNQSDVWTAGELDPGDFPRNRVHASLRASRGVVVAQWSVYAVSGFRNSLDTGRFPGWAGHDLTFLWRDAFGLGGVDLGGGVLNVADRGPPIDSSSPGSASATLDSQRGRTVFLSARYSFGPEGAGGRGGDVFR